MDRLAASLRVEVLSLVCYAAYDKAVERHPEAHARAVAG